MAIDARSLLLLLNWMSPTFPIGNFAYSHGLEQAISDGRLRDAGDIEAWIADLLQRGSGWNDAVLFSACWIEEPDAVDSLALALCGSAERYRETAELGRNFNIAAAVWTGEARRDDITAYPVAAGSCCKAFGIDRHQALLAFVQGFAAAQVSVAVRLVPLGQTRGLEILRNLSPLLYDTATRAAAATRDDLGGCALAAEVTAMRHESLEPRIFRT